MEEKNGFSLIELLIVITIIGILSTVAILSIRTGRYANVERCSANIELALGELRQEVMSSKKNEYLIIYQASDNNIYIAQTANKNAVLNADDGKQIGGPTISITGIEEFTNLPHVITYSPSVRIVITFNKSTGAFQSVDGITYGSVQISRDTISYTINLVKETGKYYRRKI